VPSAPYVVPPLLLTATLVVSAVAKLRDPRDASSVFLQLRLPRVLLRLRAPRLLPYGELVLAAFLVVAPGGWYVVAATATLLLFLAYFLVILRAVRLPYPVSCSCFGRLGLGEVTRWTLARNGVLLALALVTWADSWRGAGVAQRLSDLGGGAWWVAGAALAAVAVAFLARVHGRRAPADLDPDAYRPVPTPDGVLHGPDGSVRMWELSDVAARLLVFCDPVRDAAIALQAASWADLLAPVRVHVVAEQGTADPGEPVWRDPRGELARRLGVASPGAVLLGTDRMLAGGPVTGADAIAELVEAVATELHVAGPSAQQP
jgi:Methylamine utilisation protein MauE